MPTLLSMLSYRRQINDNAPKNASSIKSLGYCQLKNRAINMFLLVLLVVVVALYYYTTKNFNYWSDRNVKHEKPIPIFGTHFRSMFGYNSITEITMDLYNKYPNEKVIGYFRGSTPELIVKDPDLVKQILNVDFKHFYLRGFGRNVEIEPMMHNLFNVEGDTWKLLRQRLTGAFTTSKLKSMFPLVVRCAEKLQSVATAVAAQGGSGREGDGGECDVRELMARFTTEFIGTCGFGIEMDTINNDQSQFRELGKVIFQKDLKLRMIIGLCELFPELTKYLSGARRHVDKLMIDIFKTLQENRNYEPIGRNDFIDLLLELKKDGKIVGDSIEKEGPNGMPVQVELQLNDIIMAAQVFIFFAAGFETSSSTTSFTLHQLAYNPQVQTKVQEEIDSIMMKHDNKLSYDAVAEMTLLKMAFKESMRLFPSLGCLNRVCTKKYSIPGLNITIDPGVRILIPNQAIQHDEKYFDNPSEFRPERFLPENVKDRHSYVYLPFGEGLRNCIGARLGQMQSLAGLAAMLHKFTFEPGPSSTPTLPVSPYSNVVQSVKGGIPLKIKLRKKMN